MARRRVRPEQESGRKMSQSSSNPQWEFQHDAEGPRVRLSGSWKLLSDQAAHLRLARELGELGAPDNLTWDLEDIDILDSGGALTLWKAWHEQLPERLRCRDDQRSWFERLARLEQPAKTKAERSSLGRLLDHLGARVIAIAGDVGGILLLTGRILVALSHALAHPRLIPWREISANIYRSGAQAVPLLGFVGFLIGIVMTYQIALSISRFGANMMIVNLLGVAVLRELGAVVTAIILTGRSGSAITAGIGGMRLREEIDALHVLGVSSTLRLVLPRVIGMGIAVALLVVWVDFVGLIGGIVISQTRLGVPPALFVQRLPEVVPWINFWIGLGKGVIFGILIGIVACYYGLKVQRDTQSLSRETTAAVVVGLSLILILDASSGVLLSGVGLF